MSAMQASAPRTSEVRYETKETKTAIQLNLDGTGQTEIATGIGFFDHMLHQFAFHGFLDLQLKCEGDLHVDSHHTVEDVGIALGRALDQALGDRGGLRRYGHAYVPMDETLARAVLDFSGRPDFFFRGAFGTPRIGEMDTQMIPHFFKSLAIAARATLHLDLLHGENDHHRAEGLFKACGRAVSLAVEPEPRRAGVASTKGVL